MKKKGFFWLTLIVTYLVLIIFGLWYGPYRINPIKIFHSIFAQDSSGQTELIRTIVLKIRFSRLMLASFVGIALSTSGVIFQGLLRNPLADPFTLGVSTGAAFGASLAMIFGINIGWSLGGLGLLPVVSMVGALLALFFVIHLSKVDGLLRPAQMILAGIVVSTFLSALISLLKSLDEESLSAIVFWMLGSFSGRGWVHVLFAAPYIVFGLLIFINYAKELDIMSLGDIEAHHLGVNIYQVRLILLISACITTSAAVSVSGIIGFIGLVVPHLLRLIQGPSHKELLISSAILGASLMVASDLLAQNILPAGEEIPVGVITTLIGGPFFCYILKIKKQEIAS